MDGLGLPREALRVARLTLSRCRQDHVGDRAAALSFATLLSLLPLLFLGLLTLIALGLGEETLEQVRGVLLAHLVPGAASALVESLESSLQTLSGVVEALGLASLLLLFWTGSQLAGALDRRFRRIWGKRGLRERLSAYLGLWVVVLSGPVLLAVLIHIYRMLGPHLEATGVGRRALGPLSVFLLVAFAYRHLSARRSRWRMAFLAALAATALWEALVFGFRLYLRRAFLGNAVLAGLGFVPMFLFWLYLAWFAFIFGAELHYVLEAGADEASPPPAAAPPGETPPAARATTGQGGFGCRRRPR